ncbi:hypothetical protein Leryth_025113 [Lithospermum erythrorhizon]|nr:hypothetical protein Leryth_025113 [Lithospermum erythrorhizon]
MSTCICGASASSMKLNPRGHVEFPDFINALRLKRSSLAEKIFGFIDQQNIGKITFKQIHALFKLFDTDCDGKISKDFITCMRRNPLLIALFFPLLMHIDLSPTPHNSRQEIV